MAAAQLNNEAVFRTLLDRANRSNVSFYSVDPRGLVVFDTRLTTPAPGDRRRFHRSSTTRCFRVRRVHVPMTPRVGRSIGIS